MGDGWWWVCWGGGDTTHTSVSFIRPSIHANNQHSTAATTTNPTTNNDNDTFVITLHTKQPTKKTTNNQPNRCMSSSRGCPAAATTSSPRRRATPSASRRPPPPWTSRSSKKGGGCGPGVFGRGKEGGGLSDEIKAVARSVCACMIHTIRCHYILRSPVQWMDGAGKKGWVDGWMAASYSTTSRMKQQSCLYAWG